MRISFFFRWLQVGELLVNAEHGKFHLNYNTKTRKFLAARVFAYRVLYVLVFSFN